MRDIGHSFDLLRRAFPSIRWYHLCFTIDISNCGVAQLYACSSHI